MIAMNLQHFVSEFLGFLEQWESRLLSWGFYDVAFSIEEIEDLIEAEGSKELVVAWRKLRREGWGVASLLDEMEHAGLLYQIDAGGEMYRTRFSEGVRLIARLRQMFSYKDWATGPGLVSDIKLYLAPRRYPKRDHTAEDCWSDLEPLCSRGDLQRSAFDALAADREGQPLR